MPQTFVAEVQGCVVPAAQTPPFVVTVPIVVGPLAQSLSLPPPFTPVL
jgi:hypothetical protein